MKTWLYVCEFLPRYICPRLAMCLVCLFLRRSQFQIGTLAQQWLMRALSRSRRHPGFITVAPCVIIVSSCAILAQPVV